MDRKRGREGDGGGVYRTRGKETDGRRKERGKKSDGRERWRVEERLRSEEEED